MIGVLFRKSESAFIGRRFVPAPGNRNIPFFESNVLGGASVVNGCVHAVGDRELWRDFLGRFKIEFKDILEGFRDLYTLDVSAPGKIPLKLAPRTKLDLHISKSLSLEMHLNSGDTNFSDSASFGAIYNTVARRHRSSVLNLIHGRSFSILLGHEALDLAFSPKGRLVGVVTNSGLLKADFVVLSAGVIGSNSFLLRQRDGHAGRNLPTFERVGKGVGDHLNLRVNVLTKGSFGSLNEVSEDPIKKILLYLRHWIGIPSLMSTTGATTSIQLDLDGDGRVDTKINILHFSEEGRHGSSGKYFHERPGFSLSITPIMPMSRGSICLDDGDLSVDPGYLSEKSDVTLLKTALQWCMTLLTSPSMKPLIDSIVEEELILSDPFQYIFKNVFSGHHLIGGAHDLIDHNFQCYDIPGLFICDASIMDRHLSSNIHAPVVLLSDQFAKRLIKIGD